MQEKIKFGLYKLIQPRSMDLFLIPGMKKKVHNVAFVSLLLKYYTQAVTFGFCELACFSTVVYHPVCLNTKYYHWFIL